MADNVWYRWWSRQFVAFDACCATVVEQLLLVVLVLLATQGLVSSDSALYVAVLIVSMFVSLVSAMEVFVCRERFVFFYELESLSSGRCGWRDRLLALWILHTLGLWLLWPVLSCAFVGQGLMYLAILLHWSMLSPAVFLLWYLMRLILLGREYARWLAMLLLLPWVVPVLFLLLSMQTALVSYYAYSAICLGCSLCSLALVPAIIDYVSGRLYQALCVS